MTSRFRLFAHPYQRTIYLGLALLVTCAIPVGPVLASTPIDKVAVIVNDGVITESEVTERLQQVERQLKTANRGQLPPASALRKQVLDSMIVEQVQAQRAKELGITVTDEMVTQAYTETAQRNGMTMDQFRASLKKQGIDEAEFREQLRTQTAIRQLVNREVNSRIQVSEKDVDDYLRQREQQRSGSVEYNISHILLPTSNQTSDTETARALKLAQDIRQQITGGKSFATLAATHSRDQYALQGGEIGWRAAGQLPEIFVDALKKMKPGEVSPVLRSANGFHLLKLNQLRGTATPSYRVTQTHARHILLKTGNGISDQYTRQRLQQLRRRIVSGEDFGKLARVHSEDVASAINDGDLGWVTPGSMVPSFQQAMDRLKPGEMSQVVATPYGYHLVQVLERRQKDIGEEKLRADARRELHVRKAEEYYQTWIRRLRDQAYVEIVG